MSMGQSQGLADESCEPCKRTTPSLPTSEYEPFLSQLNGSWRIEPFPGSRELGVLQRRFEFKNFRQAMQFGQAIGDLAEKQKHHPEMLIGWGHVDVAWWSHAISGVSWNE